MPSSEPVEAIVVGDEKMMCAEVERGLAESVNEPTNRVNVKSRWAQEARLISVMKEILRPTIVLKDRQHCYNAAPGQGSHLILTPAMDRGYLALEASKADILAMASAFIRAAYPQYDFAVVRKMDSLPYLGFHAQYLVSRSILGMVISPLWILLDLCFCFSLPFFFVIVIM